MTPDLHRLLLDRLQQQGVSPNESPALLRYRSKLLETNPGIDMRKVSAASVKGLMTSLMSRSGMTGILQCNSCI